MKTLFTFLSSILIPGVGQIILKDYKKGVIILTLSIVFPYLIINVEFLKFIPIVIPHIILIIWSITEVYERVEKMEGRKSAVRNLIFSILIVVVILPSIFFLLIYSFLSGGEYIQREYFSEDKTNTEMSKITIALEKYKEHYGFYPNNYDSFISEKPIRSSWKLDSWKTPYEYKRSDLLNYELISAGNDKIFNNEDDIKRSN